ncbi:hypothetical protein [Mycolicibacterium fortuitum]|uniref:hypothetical protein n=1 Tax=Mycolicibacterium fortuitum TaxID=1766 RepID=UPI001054BFB3|nr:hypothetical protein [Mycolicibacterium fortuitum]
MVIYSTQWDINLRANLRLWPEPLDNIRALSQGIDNHWDEAGFATQHFGAEDSQDRRRAVRQTYEAMAYEGLMFRDEADVLRTTPLGDFVLRFLGVVGPRKFANNANRIVPSAPLIRGLAVITEVRVIWTLMRGLGNRLSNEELNRAMARIESTADVGSAIQDIAASRRSEDPTGIGPRLYDEGKFGTPEESAQRKAINPHFLLAGGGAIFIDVDSGNRTLLPAVNRLIDGALQSKVRHVHAGTSRNIIEQISRASLAPKCRTKELND